MLDIRWRDTWLEWKESAEGDVDRLSAARGILLGVTIGASLWLLAGWCFFG